MLVVGLSPMLVSTLGGYVTEYYGWYTVFLSLMCMGIVIMIASCTIRLPNSFEPDRSISLKPRPIILKILSIAKEPQFYTYALLVLLLRPVYICCCIPIIFMNVFKVDAKRMVDFCDSMSLSFIISIN
jgi:DHA1 family bicyclomycin/chloramphenicol resistance-like MFS transporter